MRNAEEKVGCVQCTCAQETQNQPSRGEQEAASAASAGNSGPRATTPTTIAPHKVLPIDSHGAVGLPVRHRNWVTVRKAQNIGNFRSQGGGGELEFSRSPLGLGQWASTPGSVALVVFSQTPHSAPCTPVGRCTDVPAARPLEKVGVILVQCPGNS